VNGDDGSEWDALFAAADHRLHAAKDAGRNRGVGPGSGGAAAKTADALRALA